jgi:hypothetical protein
MWPLMVRKDRLQATLRALRRGICQSINLVLVYDHTIGPYIDYYRNPVTGEGFYGYPNGQRVVVNNYGSI